MRRRLLFSLVAIQLAIGGGVALRLGRFAEDAVPAPSAAVSPAIPITAGVSATADVPVYLTGLGAVQALNTVTVKVRGDGQLDKVNFTEGQDVKAGDVLAQIDPRTYQAQLDQSVAKKSLDEANLANARRDLDRYTGLAKTNSWPCSNSIPSAPSLPSWRHK